MPALFRWRARRSLRPHRWFALALFLAGVAGTAAARHATADAEPLPLVPLPAEVVRAPGAFAFDADTTIRVAGDDPQAAVAARQFAALLEKTHGISLRIERNENAARQGITFSTDATAPAGTEAYALEVDPRGIRIRARDGAGLYYGGITLWQLLTAKDDASLPLDVPALRIEDAPRFAWRGLMLDTARHFRSVDEIKRFLDWMALHKLNTFHWHLTDDQGWRLQIERYPELTGTGAWRTPAGAAARDGQGRPRRYGGFYTQAQAREIVAYAAARHITVVPEIELPGHAQAAIASYPELGVTGRRPPVANGWGVSPHLFNVEESTFAFLQDVLQEVMAIFPGRYIHVGGDEAAKGQWENSARVQQRMRELGIADEHALQSWFIGRIGRYLDAHGRRLVGWDEILEGGLPAGATVMSWRGTKGAVDAARQGHDVVLSPGVPLYFDQKQGMAADEPPGQPALNTLEKVYAFDPIPEELTPAQARHVLGAQANLWAEYMRTFEQVQHAAFPRAAALAEVLWSPAAQRDWPGFRERLVPQLLRYRQFGINVADSAFAVRIQVAPTAEPQHGIVSLSNQAGFGAIRYTLDGSAPTPRSPEYVEPMVLPFATTLKAASFHDGIALAAPRERTVEADALRVRRSEDLLFCNGENGIRLEDDAPLQGPRAVLHTQLGSVCLRWPDAPLEDVATIRVQVGQVENAFMYGKPGDGEPKPVASVEPGELRVYRGECGAAAPLAVLPLAPARANPSLTTLQAPLPAGEGTADLCLRTEGAAPDLTWAVTEVALLPEAAP